MASSARRAVQSVCVDHCRDRIDVDWLRASAQHGANANILTAETVDTSTLIGNAAGPFSLAFVLTDGSATGDGNNTATLSGFAFANGNAGVTTSTMGGASGDLISGVTLTDSSFFNVLVSSFTPGSTLSFQLNLTTNIDAGSTPDQFSFALLNADGSAVATTDTSGADSLLIINIDSAAPAIEEFSVAAVPEPSTFLFALIASGFGCIRLGASSLRLW